MAFRFASNHPGPASLQAPSSRSIKSLKSTHPKSAALDFNVPKGPNWVFASGGAMPVRFDFAKALEEHIASQDETCGSSQEYYARKAVNSSSTSRAATSMPPKSSAYNADPRFLYPTQRPVYTFNFSKATRADIDNMNTALPFSPSVPPERKKKSPKGLDKVPNPLGTSSFVFGSITDSFDASSPSTVPAVLTDKSSTRTTPTVSLRSHTQEEKSYYLSSATPPATGTTGK